MKKIVLVFSILLLIGCSLSKQEIVDKCLLQANQKFPTDLLQSSKFFQGCMAKYKYAFNAHNCEQNNQEHIFSEICYVKY
jgi:hypothetical protein